MNRPSKIFVLVLSGREADALTFAQRRYPESDAVFLSKTELRESGWKGRLRKLRQLDGDALLIFAEALESLQELTLLEWTTLMHRCRETVFADAAGSFEVVTK